MAEMTGIKMSEIASNTVVDRNSKILVYNPTTNKTETVSIVDAYKYMVEQSAGAHNGIFRGKDITDLFYNGTLSKQITAGTFDDIFVGDYIIGKVSKRKYLVADLDYRYGIGDPECKSHHILMIPERTMGNARMNATNTADGAYIGSEMYKTNLAPYKTIIQNDFETSHILTHRNHFQNAVTNGYESAGTWYDSTIDLMNESMVYGSNHFHNIINGTGFPNNYEVDNSQLALFRLDHSKIIARNDAGERYWWWLRNVASGSNFCLVDSYGSCDCSNASSSGGVRPAFLIV